MENTWGLQFVQIDEANNDFKYLFGVNCGTEQEARKQFDKIKRIFPTFNTNEYDCIVDLIDENDDIYEDHALSFEQVKEIAFLMGAKMN